jgi:integrase
LQGCSISCVFAHTAKWVQLARGEVGIADRPEPERKTIGMLLDVVRDDYEARKKASAKNLNLIETIRSEVGAEYADAFKTKRVREYVKSLAKPPKRKGRRARAALADSSIRHRLHVLAKAFELENFARVEDGFEPLMVPQFPECNTDNRRSGFLERPQLDILVKNLPAHLKDYTLFMYITGWRKSAVASLEWDPDVRDGCVFLRGMKSKNGLPYFVPETGEIHEIIERRRAARKLEAAGTVMMSNLVFHDGQGNPVQEFRKSWRTACREAGVPHLLVHDLRRCAARNLIRSGASEDVAMQVGGWRSRSIFTRYNVTSEADVIEAVKQVNLYNAAESKKVVQMGAAR